MFASMLRNGATLDRRALAVSWQLVDLGVLRADPLGSTWYLHTQPPLYNLFVGSVLRWSPTPPIGTLFVLYFACLIVTGLLLVSLGSRWGAHPVLAGTAAGVALTTPSALRTVVQGSYEVPLATLVVLALWLVQRHVDSPRPGTLVGLSTVLTTLVMVRSVFHPLWLLAVLALVAIARPVPARAVAIAVAVPLVVVGGWMGKNQVLFDQATLSSWAGFNAQRGVVAPLDEDAVAADVADGTVTPLATQAPWRSIEAYPDREPCRPDERHRAISRSTKGDAPREVANFNHSCYLPLYEESRHNATRLAREHPVDYLRSRGAALAIAFAVTPLGTDDPSVGFTGSRAPTRTSMDGVGSVVLLPVGTAVPMDTWNLPLLGWEQLPIEVSITLIAGFLVVVGRGGLGLVRLASAGWRDRAETWPPHEVTWIVAASAVGLLVVGAAMVELGENDRFRATIDPLLLALPLFLVGRRMTTWRPGRARGDATALDRPPGATIPSSSGTVDADGPEDEGPPAAGDRHPVGLQHSTALTRRWSVDEGPTATMPDREDDPTAAEEWDQIEDLYRAEHAPMVKLAHLLVGDWGLAEELVQDAFLRLRPRLNDIEEPGAYLRTIVVNLCRSAGRRRAVAERHRAADSGPDPVDPPPLPPELDEVWLALRRLPPRRRDALILRYYADLSTDEVARLLDTRPSTARSLIRRGLASLKKELEP
ncbi:sigma-70 family RNA polymerase sigma factor [Iamia majanohamensis]|uniref:Sigma-70 family RNA polymerase sigma factor n=1 Tax=Iamia majanohamensis TaxID=467976 RepID=A0AAE9Y428_9ACTN|nr:sigma-70 family RNA polymerase sigma factor [Iamia majanohamensis]WCO65757.1 sigma-70 family RNA polymerase sigma factor [Iamia majanohamensis]